MSSVNLFNTGKSALFANRAALSTTGHNIANVNTEGYSRQRVEQTTQNPTQLGNMVFGTGVKLRGVFRVNDDYLTKQISQEMKLKGQYEETNLGLAQAENIFNELSNEGLNRIVARFFNEFRKLGNEPESEALRETVKAATDQLVGDFHRIHRSIGEIQKNLDTRIDANVRELNKCVEKIADLNYQIKKTEVSGSNANDFLDARDLEIKRLSTIADIQVSFNEKNELTVALANAGPLISGKLYNKLYVQTAKGDVESGRSDGSLLVYMEGRSPPEITHTLKRGKLGGLLETRDEFLGKTLNKMNELAYSMTTKINEIHREGYALNGSTGIDFFKPLESSKNAAEQMSLSYEVSSDAKNIATALVPNAPGDNRLTQFIARLQHARIMSEGQSTFDEFYNATVADLSTVTQKNKQVLEHQDHVIGQLEKFRESVAGVSLDEETTNLVQYQHAFDASAKVIKVADDMLETVLNLKR